MHRLCNLREYVLLSVLLMVSAMLGCQFGFSLAEDVNQLFILPSIPLHIEMMLQVVPDEKASGDCGCSLNPFYHIHHDKLFVGVRANSHYINSPVIIAAD